MKLIDLRPKRVGADLRGVCQLGSNVNQSDVNADAFILAAGITDNTQKTAITTFVKDLKAINTVQENFVNFTTPEDSICLAIYPIVGGSANSHKFNLINPADSDAAFRLTFAGSLTHDIRGIKGSTTGNIFTHLSSALVGETSHGIDIMQNGVELTTVPNWSIISNSSPFIFHLGYQSRFGSNGKEIYDSRKNCYSNSGLNIGNRTSQSMADCQLYSGLTKVISAENATSLRAVGDFTILSYNTSNECPGLISYAAIRKSGVNDAAILLYREAIMKYQHNLNRLQVNNIIYEGHSFLHNQPSGTLNVINKVNDVLNANYSTRLLNYFGSAVSGSYISDCVSRKSTLDSYYFNKYGVKNIVVLWIGINDVAVANISGEDTYAAYKLYHDSLIATGWNVIPLTACEALGGVGEQETRRQTFNALLKSDLGNTNLIDCDEITQLSDSTNLTYFQADQIHLTEAGNIVAGALIVDKINSI